jgi:hypothetical protein
MPKAGSTWTQQIVGQLIFGGREDIEVATLSPWLDLRVPPRRSSSRRSRRSGIADSPDARYI